MKPREENADKYEKFLEEGEKVHKAELKKTSLSARQKKRHQKALDNIKAKKEAFEKQMEAVELLKKEADKEALKKLAKK